MKVYCFVGTRLFTDLSNSASCGLLCMFDSWKISVSISIIYFMASLEFWTKTFYWRFSYCDRFSNILKETLYCSIKDSFYMELKSYSALQLYWKKFISNAHCVDFICMWNSCYCDLITVNSRIDGSFSFYCWDLACYFEIPPVLCVYDACDFWYKNVEQALHQSR